MLRNKLHFNGFPFSWKKVCKNLLWRNHHCPYSRLWRFCLFHELFLAYLFQAHRGLSFHACTMKCILSWDAASRFDNDIFLYVLVASYDSHFPLMLSCWCSMHRVRTLFFILTCQYISHCLSNLTDIVLVDYLVVDWVCSFDRVFVLDFFPM